VLVRRAAVPVIRPRLALAGFFAALIAVHAVAGALQPVLADDWEHLLWDARHDGGWLVDHLTLADAMGYVLAHSAAMHAVVCALAAVALVIGIFVLAHRRLPRPDSWDDVIGVIAASAMVWIAQPRAGLIWFQRSNVAWHLCGCAIAVWLIAPLRCGWRIGRSATGAIAIAGWLVGTSNRQAALATLFGFAFAVRRTRPRDRTPWMWIALGTLFAGTVAGFFDPPYVEAARVWNRGFEPNLIVLNLPIREAGQVIVLILLLVLAKLLIDERHGEPRATPALPEPRETRAWFWAWFGVCVISLLGPRYGEPTVLSASVVIAIAALPYLPWLHTTRAVRWAVAAIMVGIHAIVWPVALVTYVGLSGEYRDRIERLEHAPPGSIAAIAPYSEILPTSWTVGEDWISPKRQMVGIEVYGVRDIVFWPRFGRVEDNPQVEIAVEVDGLSPAQVRAASPVYWATDVVAAREQFESFIDRARDAGPDFTARLVARLDFAERRGRPLVVAWYEHGALTSPKVTRGNPDPNDRQRVSLPAALGAVYREAYIVRPGGSESTPYDGAAYHVESRVAGRVAVVACSPARCLLVDAWVPRF
jgi:hypothetical protein